MNRSGSTGDVVARAVEVAEITRWRDLFRHESACQIIHDSLHSRPGWTQSYSLEMGGIRVGYGGVAVGGPWKGKPTIFEYYVLPSARSRVFDLFEALLAASGAVGIEAQSNIPLVTVMIHLYAENVVTESILYHDRLTTDHQVPGAVFRKATPEDDSPAFPREKEAMGEWVVEFQGTIAATGGILFHYNRPYGDLYMAVAEPFRKRGLGTYLVQEMKRVCYETGNVPAARCNPQNIASRRTLQKAGFVPCGHILIGGCRRTG